MSGATGVDISKIATRHDGTWLNERLSTLREKAARVRQPVSGRQSLVDFVDSLPNASQCSTDSKIARKSIRRAERNVCTPCQRGI